MQQNYEFLSQALTPAFTYGLMGALLFCVLSAAFTAIFSKRSIKSNVEALSITMGLIGALAAVALLICNFISGKYPVEPVGEYFIDRFEPIATYSAIGFVLTLAVRTVISFLTKKVFDKQIKTDLFALLLFAVVLGVTMLIGAIAKKYSVDYLENNYVNNSIIGLVFLPVAITLLIAVVGGVTTAVLSKKRSPISKKSTVILGIALLISVVATLVTIAVYYTENIDGDGYYTAQGSMFSGISLYLGAIIIVAAVVVAAFITDDKKLAFNAKMIARAGVCVALSFALSYVKIFALPQGGSVTLASALPIMIFAFVYGPKAGLIIGFIYGLLQAVQDPFIIHPAQFLLDYPVAFSMLGMAGVLSKTKLPTAVKFSLGAVISAVLRYSSHVVSGIFAFGAYAPEGYSVVGWSFLYNLFVFADIALAVAVGAVLVSNKQFNRFLEA